MSLGILSFMGWEVHLEHRYARDSIDIYIDRPLHKDGKFQQIYIDKENGDFAVKEIDGNKEVKPSLTLPETVLIALFNALWEKGYRPENKRYEREADLLKAHLEDMRKLVFLTDKEEK